jgi:O-antigen/teichoic acid export membrane protein
MGVMLLTVPAYLRLLGDARYGVLALVWVVLGYFSFLELGLGKATANQIARTAEGAGAERAEIFWTALAVNTCMGVVGATALALVGNAALVRLLSMPPEFQLETTAALPWLIFTFPVALWSSVLTGTLEGLNRFAAVNCLQIATSIFFQLVPLAVAYWFEASLSVVIPAAVLTKAVMNIAFFVACLYVVPLTTMPTLSASRFKSLFRYGGWVALSGFAGPLVDTAERFVIGAILGPVAVTHYSIPMQLVGKLKILPGAMSRALFPALSSGTTAATNALAARSTAWLACLMGLAAVIGLQLLDPFLRIWVGERLADAAAPLGEILLIGVWLASVGQVSYFHLQARGRPDLVAKLHGAELLPYVLVSVIAVYSFGLLGAACTWVARCAFETGMLLVLARMPRTLLKLIAALFGVIATIAAVMLVLPVPVPWRLITAACCLIAGSSAVLVRSKARPTLEGTA